MERERNPYAPGAGLQPPELAGRETVLTDAALAMDRMMLRRPTKGMMLLGLRGVGKTVLLNRLVDSAKTKGFQVAKIEAPEGGALAQLLAPELRRVIYALDLKASVTSKLRSAARILQSFVSVFKVTIGEFEFGVEPSRGVADTGILQQDLPQLLAAVAEAAAERGTVIGLFIDEIQYLSAEELAAIVVSCHELAQRGLPLLLVGAGLPQIAALAGNAKSYAERLFTFPEVGQLADDAAHDALVRPAQKEGVDYEAAAVTEIIRLTEGYPYFLQEWGSHVWDHASQSPFKLRDVEAATPRVIQHLDANFFRVRFDRLSGLQHKYLRAMAELGPGPHKTGAIATTLGVEASTIAPTRQQLIDKGMVWSQRHGETAFTVPMFDAFMRRQMPALEKHVPRRRR